MESHGPNCESLSAEQVGVIAPERNGTELIEASAAVVALTGPDRV